MPRLSFEILFATDNVYKFSDKMEENLEDSFCEEERDSFMQPPTRSLRNFALVRYNLLPILTFSKNYFVLLAFWIFFLNKKWDRHKNSCNIKVAVLFILKEFYSNNVCW